MRMRIKRGRYFVLTALASVILISCSKDEDNSSETMNSGSTNEKSTFTVTVKNVFRNNEHFEFGKTDLIDPGTTYTFSFNAGVGHYLQFATMLAQSNDLFIAAEDQGVLLYDDNNNPLTGDVTSNFIIWDAGTEVNEEPGVGENQAPRQDMANSGVNENGVVTKLSNVMDGYSYPAVSELYNISLSHDGGTLFTLTIENKSNASALSTPFAPGIWVIHNNGKFPLFEENSSSSVGLERLAEDGNNDELNNQLLTTTGLSSPFAPGSFSIGQNNEIFTLNQAASESLEKLAEDGDPSGFNNIFNTPDGSNSPGPIHSNDSYSFTFQANKGEKLSLALMLVQSNDLFIGIDNMELFPGGSPINGNISSNAKIYDAGTEVDEYPGVGFNQAPRQGGENTGDNENGVVKEESMLNNIPSINEQIEIIIQN